MVLSNGYVVEVEGRFYGPYLKYDDAVAAHEGEDATIKALNGHPFALTVKDCDRSECNHCRNTEREGRKSMETIKAKFRREAASE